MTDIEPAVPPPAPVDIPYGFARAHGVVIAPGEDGVWLATLREGSDPAVLIEVSRGGRTASTVTGVEDIGTGEAAQGDQTFEVGSQ